MSFKVKKSKKFWFKLGVILFVVVIIAVTEISKLISSKLLEQPKTDINTEIITLQLATPTRKVTYLATPFNFIFSFDDILAEVEQIANSTE